MFCLLFFSASFCLIYHLWLNNEDGPVALLGLCGALLQNLAFVDLYVFMLCKLNALQTCLHLLHFLILKSNYILTLH